LAVKRRGPNKKRDQKAPPLGNMRNGKRVEKREIYRGGGGEIYSIEIKSNQTRKEKIRVTRFKKRGKKKR